MIEIKSAMMYMIYIYIFSLPLISEKFLSGRFADLLLFLIFLIYILKIIIDKDVRRRFKYGINNLRKDVLDIFIIILFISMCFSIFYSYDKGLAISETLRFSSYIILYFIIKYEIIDEKGKENMLKVYISITSILCIMGIIQYFTNIGLDRQFKFVFKMGAMNRITVTLSNPNNYGSYLILGIFPVLLLAIKERKSLKKLVYSVIFLMMLINIFFTYSRNSWLGFIAGCLVLVFIFSWKVIVIFGGIGAIGLFIPRIFKRLSQIFDIQQNQSRINLWKIAGYMIKDHPLFGVGNGNYVSLYNKYASKYPALRYENQTSFPCHNSYLKVQTELGIIGTFSFIGVLLAAWFKVRNLVNTCNNVFINTFYTGFLASMIAFYFMNISDNLFFVPKTTTYFWILLAISQSFILNNKKPN